MLTPDTLNALSDKHILKHSPESYKTGFIQACLNVYPPAKLAKILQEKFFIPNDSAFDPEKFYQSAAELSVANHIKNSSVHGFAVEKKINPPKDVDVYYEVPPVHVGVEVKCAVEPQSTEGALVLKMAGRVPNHLETFEDLKTQIESAHPTKTFELGKNKDLTTKDFLISAQSKFAPNPGLDDLNVLFIACGHYFNMNEWHLHLYGNLGFFTNDPLSPAVEFKNVDVVILSNLKYCHAEAREFHDWTLKNVFLLPFVNPHGRSSLTREAVTKGLSIFVHHLKKFSAYRPTSLGGDVPSYVMEGIKVNSYVDDLPKAENERYFPVKRPEQLRDEH